MSYLLAGLGLGAVVAAVGAGVVLYRTRGSDRKRRVPRGWRPLADERTQSASRPKVMR